MANAKGNGDPASGAMAGIEKPGKAKRALKTGVILAAAGLTALAISRRMKSRKGKPAGKTLRAKAKVGVGGTVRKVKIKARTR